MGNVCEVRHVLFDGTFLTTVGGTIQCFLRLHSIHCTTPPPSWKCITSALTLKWNLVVRVRRLFPTFFLCGSVKVLSLFRRWCHRLRSSSSPSAVRITRGTCTAHGARLRCCPSVTSNVVNAIPLDIIAISCGPRGLTRSSWLKSLVGYHFLSTGRLGQYQRVGDPFKEIACLAKPGIPGPLTLVNSRATHRVIGKNAYLHFRKRAGAYQHALCLHA